MNSLSWFLYFADVLPAVSRLLGFISVLGSLVFSIILALCFEGGFKYPLKLTKWVYPIAAVMLIVSVLIPEKNTLYAIAASEMGEKVVESRLGQKAQQALEAWIDNQLPKKEAK